MTSAVGVEEFPAWSPDGRTISYTASPGGSWEIDWDIWVTQSGGTPVNRTADHVGKDLFPSWSPDGSQIAFWSERDGGGCYVMPALGGAARRVATASFHDPNRPVDVLNVAAGKAEPLTDGQTNVWSPSWSADGSSLFYVSNAGGSADLWQQRFDSDGNRAGEPVAVSGGIGMRNLALSPDGGKLAYTQGRKVANLHRVPTLAARRATWVDAAQITFDQAFVESADLWPDGQRLAVSSDRAGKLRSVGVAIGWRRHATAHV